MNIIEFTSDGPDGFKPVLPPEGLIQTLHRLTQKHGPVVIRRDSAGVYIHAERRYAYVACPIKLLCDIMSEIGIDWEDAEMQLTEALEILSEGP